MRKEKNPGAGILDEFKAEALAYGFKLVELQIHPERKLPSPYERRGLSGLPERAEQIRFENVRGSECRTPRARPEAGR